MDKELEALKEKYADVIASLSPEDKAKVDACKTVGELTALAQNAEGELPDEVLEAVAGGALFKNKEYKYDDHCPFCGGKNVEPYSHVYGSLASIYFCNPCRRLYDAINGEEYPSPW